MNKKLERKLQKASFQMFRDWTEMARLKYPDFDFTIIDETVLKKDLINTIRFALKALQDREKSKRTLPGYDVGFVLGFIQSNLNGHWVHEYIRKRSNDYKLLISLRAIQLYIHLDEIALIKMDQLYKRIYIEDVNFTNINFKLDNRLFQELTSDMEIRIDDDRQNSIAIALDNLFAEQLVKLPKKEDTFFLPETEKYFSSDDVVMFISEFD